MESFITLLFALTLPAYLHALFRSSKRLDAKPKGAGQLAEWISWSSVGLSALASILFITLTDRTSISLIVEFLQLGVRVDRLTITVYLLVAFLGSVIVRFSRNYLAGDPQQGRFFKWMLITLGAVLALVMAPGLIQFLIAWILTSIGLNRLLIYFPYRAGTMLSAKKKLVMSRLGDVCLVAAFVGIYLTFETQDFSLIFAKLDYIPSSQFDLGWATWLIVIAALLKSAQFPFHIWLPDTMGAPTPVSALMHAGIINGGGYLVVRMSPLLVKDISALHLLAVFGAVTAIYGACVMLAQTSVKRALAYSTIAQMGFMMLQCGLGAFHLAVLHLVAHSLYKAHAFLSCGSAVEIAKRLNAKPHYSRIDSKRIWVAVLISAIIVTGLGIAFKVSPSEKPGMLVLSLVVVMSLTQLLWTSMRRGQSGISFAGSAGVAGSIAALYYFLAGTTYNLLGPELPDQIEAAPFFEVTIALTLLAFLITSIRFQDGEPGFLSVAYKRRLYVHALNGFYVNIWANRVAEKIGWKFQQK